MVKKKITPTKLRPPWPCLCLQARRFCNLTGTTNYRWPAR